MYMIPVCDVSSLDAVVCSSVDVNMNWCWYCKLCLVVRVEVWWPCQVPCDDHSHKPEAPLSSTDEGRVLCLCLLLSAETISVLVLLMLSSRLLSSSPSWGEFTECWAETYKQHSDVRVVIVELSGVQWICWLQQQTGPGGPGRCL